uniref:uncharacterized protein n=1 Tax=Pristiophorus japonicus TaxID=55135 RepID=UPI00398E5621
MSVIRLFDHRKHHIFASEVSKELLGQVTQRLAKASGSGLELGLEVGQDSVSNLSLSLSCMADTMLTVTEPVYTELATLTEGQQQQQGCGGEEEEDDDEEEEKKKEEEKDFPRSGEVSRELGFSKPPAWYQNSERAFTCRTQSSGSQQDAHRQVNGRSEDAVTGRSWSPSRPTEHRRPGPQLQDTEEEDYKQSKKQRCSSSLLSGHGFDPASGRRPPHHGDPSRPSARRQPSPFPVAASPCLARLVSPQPCSPAGIPARPRRRDSSPGPPASPAMSGLPPAVDSGRTLRVMGLYADLVQELQVQLAELQRRGRVEAELGSARERHIEALEAENRRLKDQLQKLEEENDFLSSGNERGNTMRGLQAGALDASKKNITFLKDLVELLESNMDVQDPPSDSKLPLVPLSLPSFLVAEETLGPVELYREVSDCPGVIATWNRLEESAASPLRYPDIRGLAFWDTAIKDTLPDGSLVWACPVEANGRPKAELIPGSGVYLTNREVDELSQVSRDKPKLMTRKLLGYFFSHQTLARSSARGERIAHNKTTLEKPICLPTAVTDTIKDYVTFVCGRGCDFNAVINSKCATSRRTVRKLTEKMK